MSTNPSAKATEMPLVHAALALLLIVGVLSAGTHLSAALLLWPFYLLAPLVAYFVVVLAVAPLRRTLTWIRVGRLDRGACAAVAAIVIASSAALIIWYELARPDVSSIIQQLPRVDLPVLLLAGLVFSSVNALLEEILFRGLLYDALATSYGCVAALILQAGFFGSMHVIGFPNGAVGVVLASIFGLMQGALRLYTGGLAACWVAHTLVDATIFWLLSRSAS